MFADGYRSEQAVASVSLAAVPRQSPCETYDEEDARLARDFFLLRFAWPLYPSKFVHVRKQPAKNRK